MSFRCSVIRSPSNRHRSLQSGCLREQGAALVEFAISSIGLLAIIAFVVDSAILFQRYSFLTDTTAALTRRISSEIVHRKLEAPSSSDARCTELVCRSQSVIADFKTANSLIAAFSFSPVIIGSGAELQPYAPYPLVRVVGEAPARCILCSIVPWQLTLRTQSILVIESATTMCNSSAEYTVCQ